MTIEQRVERLEKNFQTVARFLLLQDGDADKSFTEFAIEIAGEYPELLAEIGKAYEHGTLEQDGGHQDGSPQP